MTDSPRVADIVARTFAKHGTTHAFGMPGGEVVTLVDALQAAGISFILARNETAAAMMAAGAYTATGAPGLLVTTIGPGLANAVNGIADAAQEHVPLLVISGVVDHAVRARYTHQVVDHAALLRPLVKASFEIEANGASATVGRAIALAFAEPMGPVHLDLAPETAARGAADVEILQPPRCAVLRLALADPELAAVREHLSRARRPLIIAGLGAVKSGAGAAVQALMERIGAPLLTTYKAKGLVGEDHPLALGAAGLSPTADGILLPLVRAADLVVLAGYDPIEMRPGWLDPFDGDAVVIDISGHRADHGMHHCDVRLAADPGAVLTGLLDGLDAHAGWTDGEPEAALAKVRDAFAARPTWGPHQVFDVLQERLPPNATVTVDSGAHRILLSQQLRVSRPLAMVQSAGWCTMGSAIPLAIGIAACRPGAPVVAVLGDGGLEMTLGELGTLRDHNLPVVVLVLQDESLGLIELKQRQAGLARAAVRLGKTRYEDVAAAFGGAAWRVNDRAALDTALMAAFQAPTFTLITCEIDAGAYAGSL